MQTNDTLIRFHESKNIKNKIEWFFSCCINNHIFRIGESAIQIIKFLEDQLAELIIKEEKLNQQLQRVFQSQIKVVNSRILRAFNDENYVFLIVEIEGIEYLTFIDTEKQITQLSCLLQIRPFCSQLAIKNLLTLKQINYKIIYVKENIPSIIILCSHNSAFHIYEVRVQNLIEINLVSTHTESILNSYFVADNQDFILATNRKLIHFEYSQRDVCSWTPKLFKLQNQFPTQLYISQNNLVLIELNEGLSHKSKGIAIIFYKVKGLSSSKYTQKQAQNEANLQLVIANKKVMKMQPKSELKIKVIFENQNEMLLLFYNKEELYMVQKDKFDGISFTKIAVHKTILDLQTTNNFCCLLFFQSSYIMIQLKAAVQELQMRRSSRVIKVGTTVVESIINTPQEKKLPLSNEVLNFSQGNPDPSNTKIQKTIENISQVSKPYFNPKQEEVINEVSQQEQIDVSGKFSNPFENNIPLIQTQIFVSNTIPQPIITHTQSEDQNSDNEPSTPTMLNSSNKSQTVKVVLNPQINTSITPQISSISKFSNSQSLNIVSFGLHQLKKENEQKYTPEPSNNVFSFTQNQIIQQNLHLKKTREKEVTKDENELQVPVLIQRNFSFGDSIKTTTANNSVSNTKQEGVKNLFTDIKPIPATNPQRQQRESFPKLNYLNQKINLFKSYLQNMQHDYEKINCIQEDTGFKISKMPQSLARTDKLIKTQYSKMDPKIQQNKLKQSVQQIQQKYKCMQEMAFKNVSYFIPLNKPKLKVKPQNVNRKLKSVEDKLWQKLKNTKLAVSSLRYQIESMGQNIKQSSQNQNKAQRQISLIKQKSLNIQPEWSNNEELQQCLITQIKRLKLINVYLPLSNKEPIWSLQKF